MSIQCQFDHVPERITKIENLFCDGNLILEKKNLRSLNVRVVWTSDVKIHQQIAESKTANGIEATKMLLPGSFCLCITLM